MRLIVNFDMWTNKPERRFWWRHKGQLHLGRRLADARAFAKQHGYESRLQIEHSEFSTKQGKDGKLGANAKTKLPTPRRARVTQAPLPQVRHNLATPKRLRR